MAKKQALGKNRIRDWKGLLHDESRTVKLQVFVSLFILSVSMTFTQFGFIGVRLDGECVAYVLGLLGPLAAVALLLGKGAGTLFGLASGAVLYAHARMLPLDLVERYLISWLGAFVFYAFAGFLLGLLFAIALHNNPQGRRRGVYIAISCLVASFVLSMVFFIIGLLTVAIAAFQTIDLSADTIVVSNETAGAIYVMRGVDMQIVLDFLLMLVVCLVVDHIVRKRAKTVGNLSVRTSFRTQLFVVTALVFCIVQATSFVAITSNAKRQALEDMEDEVIYLGGRLLDEMRDVDLVSDTLAPYVFSDDEVSSGPQKQGDRVIPSSVAEPLIESHGVSEVLVGYSLDDGTVLIFYNDSVISSYNPAYPVGASTEELFSASKTGTLDDIVETDGLREMQYNTATVNLDDPSSTITSGELGYMFAVNVDDYVILIARPSSMVFANRQSVMSWASITAFAILTTVFLLAARLLNKDVVAPIDRTNESLAKITSGDLNEVVTEVDNREFASLSTGINETVGSLKTLIDEAARRNEKDLAVAKKIQESALPRTFPPFPEISAFDIYASMDAAKEVGGDFYDFFLIDDHTLGFLIADVSGKGIPGALFMMAAKAEIENYLSTGMEPAEAIASANRRLCANNDAGMFVTVWAATLDWETGLLTYVNAGHNFPLLRHDGRWEWLNKKCGLFLGTFETAKYRQMTLTLEPGDELVLYTDGVNEAFNPAEKEYGNDRLEAFLVNHNDVHPRELVKMLRSDVARWADGAEQSDDVTILALEFGAAPEVTGSLTIPATLDYLDEANALIAGELERRLCPITAQHQVEIALEELFVNVCRYAYAGADEPGEVTVSYAYSADPSSITVELRDTGVPFDPVEMDDPTKPSSIQEAKIGGLGILMVKRTMDDFAYLRDGNANVVVFRKSW